MKKREHLPEEDYKTKSGSTESNSIEEPATKYGLSEELITSYYDIPKELLFEQIERAEKDIAEGRVYTLEEAKRIILR